MIILLLLALLSCSKTKKATPNTNEAHSDDREATCLPTPDSTTQLLTAEEIIPEFPEIKVVWGYDIPSEPSQLLNSNSICAEIFDALLYMRPDDPYSIKGCLAENWSHSEDWLIWNFDIKEGITFTDGTTCNAKAIEECFDYLFELRRNVIPSYFSDLNIVNWRAVDEYEFEIKLSSPCAWFETELCLAHFRIFSPDSFKLYGSNDIRAYVGTGPYIISEHVEYSDENQACWITLTANSRYHFKEKQPYFGKIVLINTTSYSYSNDIILASLESGLLDAVSISIIKKGSEDINDVIEYYASENTSIEKYFYTFSKALWFNADKYALFGNKNVREAICRMLDLNILNDSVYYGYGRKQTSIWADGSLTSIPFDGYYYDCDEALKLLSETGVSPEDIKFNVMLSDENFYNKLSEQLGQFGITVKNEFAQGQGMTIKFNNYGLNLPIFSDKFDSRFYGPSRGSGPHAPWIMIFGSEHDDYLGTKFDWQRVYEPDIYSNMHSIYEQMISTPHWDEMVSLSRELTCIVQENYAAIPLVQEPVFFVVNKKSKDAFEAFTETSIFQLVYQ